MKRERKREREREGQRGWGVSVISEADMVMNASGQRRYDSVTWIDNNRDEMAASYAPLWLI